MTTSLGASLLAMLLAPSVALTSCSDSSAPGADFDRRSRTLRSATLTGGSRLLGNNPVRATGAGYEVSWKVQTTIEWSDYCRRVRQLVGSRMQVKTNGDGHLVLRETQPGDVHTLELRQQPGKEGRDRVLVTFSAHAW